MITAMKIHDGNLEIRSDSEYVVRTANSRMRGEAQKGYVENSDLWKEFVTAMRYYGTRQLKFTWVKGHATMTHINRRITTSLDKGGNDAADALASAAAAHHSAPKTLTDAALERQRTALVTHCFASELLFRRRVALLALHGADHGQLTDCAVVRDFPSTASSVHTIMNFKALRVYLLRSRFHRGWDGGRRSSWQLESSCGLALRWGL